MRIPNDVRKCVAFVGYQLADGSSRMAGSGFFLGRRYDDERSATYFVTAKHVIDKIQSLGVETPVIRFNSNEGRSTWLRAPFNMWRYHPDDDTVDVGIIPCGIDESMDHLAIPMTLVVSDEIFLKYEIGEGEEVFVIGLFRHHHGRERNIPIVRVGNISSLEADPVQTRSYLMDAYLIEARSIGGISGSPVFVNLGSVRIIGRELQTRLDGEVGYYLLGLMHGHFETAIADLNSNDSANEYERLNSGIGIVVPAAKILEVLNQSDLLPERMFAT